jgi:restriction endonuclease Mrr
VAVPDHQTIMLPILLFLADRQSRKTKEIVAHVAQRF